MGESLTAWVPTGENTADFLTEVLYGSKWDILWGV